MSASLNLGRACGHMVGAACEIEGVVNAMVDGCDPARAAAQLLRIARQLKSSRDDLMADPLGTPLRPHVSLVENSRNTGRPRLVAGQSFGQE